MRIDLYEEHYKVNEPIDIAYTLNIESEEIAKETSKKQQEEDYDAGEAKEEKKEYKKNKEVSCISWNSTGGIIAVGYAIKTHDTICGHHGSVALWSIFLKNFSSTKPSLLLDASVFSLK